MPNPWLHPREPHSSDSFGLYLWLSYHRGVRRGLERLFRMGQR